MKVNICGIKHEIIDTKDEFNCDTHLGQITYSELIIKINKDLPLQLREETICHEMVHGILMHLGYSQQSDDEQFVQALANAIIQGFGIRYYIEEDTETELETVKTWGEK